MLVVRRSAEKSLSSKVDSLAMASLQQVFAIPFILVTFFFAKFYSPSSLSKSFWLYLIIYAVLGALDLYCYFKALSIADISYVAPLMSLTAVGNVLGAYIVLNQTPSTAGMVGVIAMVAGAYVINRSKKHDISNSKDNRKALYLILILVVVRAYFSNIEVFMLRETNPASFNFYSSILTIPVLLIVTLSVVKKQKIDKYWNNVGKDIKKLYPLLFFIGLTYTLNMLATYKAKTVSPVAGYVAAVKSAQALPMVLVGVLFFKEKVSKQQVLGLLIVCMGLLLLAIN